MTRQVIRKAGTVTLDYEQGVVLVDGAPFPFVLAEDPIWDETDDGYLIYLLIPAAELEIKGR